MITYDEIEKAIQLLVKSEKDRLHNAKKSGYLLQQALSKLSYSFDVATYSILQEKGLTEAMKFIRKRDKKWYQFWI